MLDTLIKNVFIVDGTGAPVRVGNVGVKDGKITFETSENAERIIEGEGLYLSPGFIDAHSHGDLEAGKEYAQVSKTSQGVTTEICGHCGMTRGPVGLGREKLLIDWVEMENKDSAPWLYTFSEVMEYLEKQCKTANMATFVGHNTLRIAVMGFENRKPRPDEMERMKNILAEAMEMGALGLSTGLAYTPAIYSDIEELIELSKVVAEYHGSLTVHMRNESFDSVQSVKDCIAVAKAAKIPLFISHHKILGKNNWGLQKETLRLIEEAVQEGVEITCDQYPYTCNMTELNVCIPPRYFINGTASLAEMLKDPEIRNQMREEMENPDCGYDNYYLNAGGWDGILICLLPKTPDAAGITLGEYARRSGEDPFDLYFRLMIENQCIGMGVFSSMCEEDVLEIAKSPQMIVGSDGIVKSLTGMTHPRAFATFPQAICLYNKEKKILTLPEIIHRMTGKTAERHRLSGKGKIAEGYDADLVLFNYEKLEAKADYKVPYALTEGIDKVFVGGKIVWENQKLTGEYPGKLIRREKR